MPTRRRVDSSRATGCPRIEDDAGHQRRGGQRREQQQAVPELAGGAVGGRRDTGQRREPADRQQQWQRPACRGLRRPHAERGGGPPSPGWCQQRGQGRTDEQFLGARIGAEVDPSRAGHAGQDIRGQRGQRHSRERKRQQAPPSDRAARDQQKRPDEVKLLLHRERPGVLQRRRRPALREVVRALQRPAPVARPQRCRDRVPAQRSDRIRNEQRARRDHRDDHDERRGQQPPGTACPEPAEVDPSRDYQLVVEQGRDQEAAEDEEDIDADKATRQERDTGVSGEHRQDGKSTDTVERADTTIQSHQSAPCIGLPSCLPAPPS